MKRVALIVLAMVIGTAVVLTAMPSKAEALVKAGSFDNGCSLPCVSVEKVHGKYVATIGAQGNPTHIKVYCKGKQIRCDRVGKRTWMCFIKSGRTYTVKARAAGTKWRVIKFRIVRS